MLHVILAIVHFLHPAPLKDFQINAHMSLNVPLCGIQKCYCLIVKFWKETVRCDGLFLTAILWSICMEQYATLVSESNGLHCHSFTIGGRWKGWKKHVVLWEGLSGCCLWSDLTDYKSDLSGKMMNLYMLCFVLFW